MRIKRFPYDWEIEVFCRECSKVIVVEEPEDVTKKEEKGVTMLRLICPNCAHEIWFNTLFGHRINPDFLKQVKPYEPNYLDTALKNAKKFNKEFKGPFDKLKSKFN